MLKPAPQIRTLVVKARTTDEAVRLLAVGLPTTDQERAAFARGELSVVVEAPVGDQGWMDMIFEER